MTQQAIAGQHGWHGNCDPQNMPYIKFAYGGFSVACFEYIPKKSGGVKRGPVKVRVKGRLERPQAVYYKATEICRQLDAGTYNGPKNVWATI